MINLTFDRSRPLHIADIQSQEPAVRRRALARLVARLRSGLLSGAARPLRFAGVGGVCGLLQLVLLVVLKWLGVTPIPANVAAYLLSAQANFLLSNHFIWHDRWSPRAGRRELWRRWLGFHGSIAGTFVLSQFVFIGSRLALPDVLASALGIGAAAVVNFLIQDRLTFQPVAGRRAQTLADARSQPDQGQAAESRNA